MSDICRYCTDDNFEQEWLDDLSEQKSDIHVRISRGKFLRCTHYDWEGNADDDKIYIPINFCPVCGRKLK